MGFAPKDGQFSDGVQRKKTRLIVVQERGTFAQKLFPYLRRYKKRREEERNSVTKEEQHDTWREFKKGIERKRV